MILDNLTPHSPDLQAPLRKSAPAWTRPVAASSTFSSWRLRRSLLQAADRRAKRLVDWLAAAALLTLLSPLFALIAAAIRLESPGPVFFKQVRNGVRGRTFLVWKFRSMRNDAEKQKADLQSSETMSNGLRFKMKEDPRITKVGRLLRASSLDELPQLINVLRGEMSLVGPRPPIPKEVAEYSPRDRRRLEGVPGITCVWQVSGRSEIPFDQQVEMDIDYLQRRTLGLDIKLLLQTIPAVLFARGAY